MGIIHFQVQQHSNQLCYRLYTIWSTEVKAFIMIKTCCEAINYIRVHILWVLLKPVISRAALSSVRSSILDAFMCEEHIDDLTHWGRVTHICVNKLTIIGSDNGLSPGQRQAIIWTNAGILLIQSLGTNFSEILIEVLTFSFKKMHLNMSSAKWRPFCLSLNVLMHQETQPHC